MVCRIKISHLKGKSILSARWPQLGPGLIMRLPYHCCLTVKHRGLTCHNTTYHDCRHNINVLTIQENIINN